MPNENNRTLYISNLPDDTTQRECRHIFFPFQGFQSVVLKNAANGELYGFAEFDTHDDAAEALRVLEGYAFERDSRSIKIGFSKGIRRRPGEGRNNNRDYEHGSSNNNNNNSSSGNRNRDYDNYTDRGGNRRHFNNDNDRDRRGNNNNNNNDRDRNYNNDRRGGGPRRDY
eukprot:TRINITY_DN7725_c3_g1_i1.p1 TRINITY_DN7725_c3_g1~~TRINITY_DN7725_c3_g1_i1.p1  ORF type:complete len:170 (+),score=33.60 TRINITY_DN7725_c3_g1_i1:48-557(+)